jgi:hypothetical protein
MLMFAAGRSWYPASVRCALRPLGAAAISACFVLSSVEARAENKAETSKASSPSSASAKSSDAAPLTVQAPSPAVDAVAGDAPPSSEAAAEAAYQQAQAKYAKSDVKGALESMRESYRLCQRPELLYNLAMLERELQECRLALEDYTSYLKQVPQGRYRHAAEQASTELSRECPAVTAPSTAPPPALPPPPPAQSEPPPAPKPSQGAASHPDSPYWTPPRIVGWSAVTAGLLAGGGALYFTFAAFSARSDYDHSIEAELHGTGLYQPSLQDKQHRDQTLAQLLVVSGGALVASGALVLIFGSKDQAHATASAQIQAQPGLLGASFAQRF